MTKAKNHKDVRVRIAIMICVRNRDLGPLKNFSCILSVQVWLLYLMYRRILYIYIQLRIRWAESKSILWFYFIPLLITFSSTNSNKISKRNILSSSFLSSPCTHSPHRAFHSSFCPPSSFSLIFSNVLSKIYLGINVIKVYEFDSELKDWRGFTFFSQGMSKVE